MRQNKKSFLTLSLNVMLLALSSTILFSCSGQKKVAENEPQAVQQNSAAKERQVQDISSKEEQNVKSAPRLEKRTHL